VNKYTEVTGLDWGYRHPREAGTLTDSTNIDSSKWMPYATTTASVYGVGGSYGGGTNIHTRSVDGNDTTSIIEISSKTDNQNYFKIYSSGMLKNLCSFCFSTCDSIVIGGSGNLAPGFYLSNDDPLYILNDGDGSGNYCCEGGIRFNAAGVDSINKAVANATGGGDLHIQAHSFVKFYGKDLNFTHFANTNITNPKENEIKILSDSNAIYVEKNLTFADADTVHLTVWA
jgi:hypothetical protein